MPIIKTSRVITLERHIAENKMLQRHSSDIVTLFHDLTLAFRIISRDVRRAGISDVLGLTESTNYHGDKVRKLDVLANSTIFRAMDHGGHLCAMISEESFEPIRIPSEFKKGKYILAFDPMDGSTNIDVAANIGTIFSLFQRIDPQSQEEASDEDLLQPGIKQLISGYINYGASSQLAYTCGNGVDIFTFDPTIGEFILTNEQIQIPHKASYYSCNEGNYYKWDKNIRDYIDYIKTPSENGERPYTLRYIATAVADIHRLLHYGGIYLYPSEAKLPDGKIRLLYEANPLAMIIEQAGGKAITGKGRIMEVIPKSIHQRAPFFVGSKGNIEEFETFLNRK